MKAKGYYKKYRNKFKACIPPEEWEKFKGQAYIYAGMYPNYISLTTQLLSDFGIDQRNLMLKRKPKTIEAMMNVVKETNKKWNALSRIFEEEQGGSPINSDGWIRYMNTKINAKFAKGVRHHDNSECSDENGNSDSTSSTENS